MGKNCEGKIKCSLVFDCMKLNKKVVVYRCCKQLIFLRILKDVVWVKASAAYPADTKTKEKNKQTKKSSMRQCVENSESNMEMTYDYYSVQTSTTAFQTRAKMKATVMQQDMATTAHASKDSKDQTVTVRICYISYETPVHDSVQTYLVVFQTARPGAQRQKIDGTHACAFPEQTKCFHFLLPSYCVFANLFLLVKMFFQNETFLFVISSSSGL